MDICKEVQDQYSYMVHMRRSLHMAPELSCEEQKTARLVESELIAVGIPCERLENNGVVGHLYGKQPGPVLALRADMDALPIQEMTDAPYASKTPGVMHACGHDGHTAALLGAARVLAGHRDVLRGEVRLIFQPAEEVCLGSKGMIAAGAMEGVDSVFGMHVDLKSPVGTFSFQPGVITCAADRFSLRFQAEASDPPMALQAAGATVLALQTLCSREADPKKIFVLSCCTMNGDSSEVTIEGTCRYSDTEVYHTIGDNLKRVTENTARAFHVQGTAVLEHMAYPVVNHAGYCAKARQSAQKLFGSGCLYESGTNSVSEDFAEYLRLADGMFAQLGANRPDMSLSYPNHNARFDFDEKALYYGAALFVQYTMDLLAEPCSQQ